MTNLVLGVSLLTVVSTNWVSIGGDWKREGGTNFVRQQYVVTTNVFIQEIHYCTNRTLYSSTQGTNGPTRWTPAQGITPPPLPTMTKE